MEQVDREESRIVAEAMVKFGGGFVSALGAALQKADGGNQARIKAGFPDVWSSYLELARADAARKG